MAKIYEFPTSSSSQEEDGKDGSTGGTGGFRTSEQYEQLLEALLKVSDIQRLTRSGLAGIDLSLVRNTENSLSGASLKAHKILQKAKQMSGIPRHMAAMPAANERAQKQDAQRLENKLRNQLGLSVDNALLPKNTR